MTIKNVINMMYSGDKILILNDEGLVAKLNHKELEYPYFYTEDECKDEEGVVDSEKKEVLYFNGEKYIRKNMYKISVRGAYDVSKLRRGNFVVAEATVPFLERRLGADDIIEYSTTPKRYAYIDIEEIKGEISLIGMKSIINGVTSPYYSFTRISDFVNYLIENKITILLAWNGEAYDYKRLEEYVSKMGEDNYRYKLWWDLMLQLDAMVIYGRYARQNKLMALEKAAELEEIDGKLQLSKGFDEFDLSKVEDLEEMKRYNERDVDIEMKIIEKKGVLKINMQIANTTGVAIQRVSPVVMFDNLLLKHFHNSGVVLADSNIREKEGIEGGYTKGEGKGGLFEDVIVLDANSLYPSIIISRDYKGKFREVWQILKRFIERFIAERKRLRFLYEKEKLEEYETAQQMYKIFANSLYGALDNVAFRFFDEDMAGFITEEGRKTAMKLREIIKGLGFIPIYGDTDSIFVANVHGKEYKIQDTINRKLYPLEVKVEKKYSKMLFLTNENGEITKKRYAGMDDKGKLQVVGLEAKRSDWCDMAKNAERKVLEMLLGENKTLKDVEKYLQERIEGIRSVPVKELKFTRTVDLEKNYEKELRHVKVAKELGYYKTKRKMVFVSYLLGQKNVPIPIEEGDDLDSFKGIIDYKYYIERQLKPPIKRIINTLDAKQTFLTEESLNRMGV